MCQKSWSYDLWFLRYRVRQTEFIVILSLFWYFYPTNNLQNQKFEKMKKTLDIIGLHLFTINDNHTMHRSWAMKCDELIFLSFWTIFCPFTLLINPKNQNFQIIKKSPWRYYHFTHVYHKWKSYDVWFLRYRAQQAQFFVILEHFLPFYPLNNPKNQNFEKMKKNSRIYYHFTHVNHKWHSHHVWFLRYGVQQTKFFVMLDYFLPFYSNNLK